MRIMLRRIAVALLLAALPLAAQPVHVATLPLDQTSGLHVTPLLENEIQGVEVSLISLGPGNHYNQKAVRSYAVVLLVVDGSGTLKTRGRAFPVATETIARAPQGWSWRIEAAQSTPLHLLRIRRELSQADLAEFSKFPQFQAEPLVKAFKDCTPYKEAIKSPKTTSRTLLPENYIPRMAMGTVETTGPDTVGAHRHPMLEQLFFGLRGNDITVTADQARARLGQFSILHIPLGSNHGAEVAEGNRLHYVWMDFFADKKGQEWLQMHKPIDDKKP